MNINNVFSFLSVPLKLKPIVFLVKTSRLLVNNFLVLLLLFFFQWGFPLTTGQYWVGNKLPCPCPFIMKDYVAQWNSMTH